MQVYVLTVMSSGVFVGVYERLINAELALQEKGELHLIDARETIFRYQVDDIMYVVQQMEI